MFPRGNLLWLSGNQSTMRLIFAFMRRFPLGSCSPHLNASEPMIPHTQAVSTELSLCCTFSSGIRLRISLGIFREASRPDTLRSLPSIPIGAIELSAVGNEAMRVSVSSMTMRVSFPFVFNESSLAEIPMSSQSRNSSVTSSQEMANDASLDIFRQLENDA